VSGKFLNSLEGSAVTIT